MTEEVASEEILSPTLLPSNSPQMTDIPETLAPTSVPPRVLTVCVGQEPSSLFIYGDVSFAAQSIRQAIYDGPYDIYGYQLHPVILEKIPSLADGDAYLLPVDVYPGDVIVDAFGNWVTLNDGVVYRPSGCTTANCAQTFEGQEYVQMDILVAEFHLQADIQWSDGIPLSADDSVYSFNLLRTLFSTASLDSLRFTNAYSALDALTVEWRGIPGYQGAFATQFFTPLPEHLWGSLSPDELPTSEIAARTPIGWGPYIIDSWVAGDHISLSKNPLYHRADEGLPYFDNLVFRFVSSNAEALDALMVGECDLIDQTATSEDQVNSFVQEQDLGKLRFFVQLGTAWELAAFGIDPIDETRLRLFESVETRQAIAMCIDRQQIVDTLFGGFSEVPDSFVPADHPLHSPDIEPIEFNPIEAATLLDAVGWVDQDANPETARVASGISNIPDGTPLAFSYLVPNDAERLQVAEMIQNSLTQCGIEVEIIPQDWGSLLMAGPDGPVFGRQFEMAQFAWQTSFEPACYLFSSDQVPGPYPDFQMGWGGSNLTGFRDAEYDEYCATAMNSLPDTEEHSQSHYAAQNIFVQKLPVIPLYQHFSLVVSRPDLCGITLEPYSDHVLSQIESLNYGDGCVP